MKLVVGLGNPGSKFDCTRHNAGFMLLNAFVARLTNDGVVWLEETKFKSHIFRSEEVLFVKPQTYMNLVGEAVSKIVQFYKVDLNDVLVIHDDVDLKFGEVKLKKSSGSAGHHGVEDLFSKLGGSEFWRLRVGVGRPENNKFQVEDYVLQKFSEEEIESLKKLFESEIFDLISKFITS